MGLELHPGSLKSQSDSIISNLQEDNKALLNVLDGISRFTANEKLKSAAWSSMKGQLSNHQAVIQGLICGNETLKGVIGDEDLVEDELNAQIESLKAVNEQMQRSIGTMERCITNLIKTGTSIQSFAKYGLPIIGAAIDFGSQLYDGEEIGDATIKTVGHLGLGAVAALATGLSRGFEYFYVNNFLNLKDAGNAFA